MVKRYLCFSPLHNVKLIFPLNTSRIQCQANFSPSKNTQSILSLWLFLSFYIKSSSKYLYISYLKYFLVSSLVSFPLYTETHSWKFSYSIIECIHVFNLVSNTCFSFKSTLYFGWKFNTSGCWHDFIVFWWWNFLYKQL